MRSIIIGLLLAWANVRPLADDKGEHTTPGIKLFNYKINKNVLHKNLTHIHICTHSHTKHTDMGKQKECSEEGEGGGGK